MISSLSVASASTLHSAARAGSHVARFLVELDDEAERRRAYRNWRGLTRQVMQVKVESRSKLGTALAHIPGQMRNIRAERYVE